jgi:ATP-dependent DNA helicase HFM1/MER3
MGNTVRDDVELLDLLDTFDDDQMKEEKPVPEAFKDLEPWLYKEFGDIVELVDDVLPA